MALQQWQAREAELPAFPAGAVLFETNLPVAPLPHSYHVMLIAEGSAKSGPGGSITVPICDMTLGGIRYSTDVPAPVQKLRPSCYIGICSELGPDEARQAIEALRGLISDPEVSGSRGIYTLAAHGIYEEDPNAPGEMQAGVRCSCASLVEWCYGQIGEGVDLVQEAGVPPMSAEELWRKLMRGEAYDPDKAREKVLEWGLSGPGPWKVLLPAYQMRAFLKEAGALPYSPTVDDHPFATA